MGGKLMTPKDQVLEVWGDLACFTRPELKVERFSYPIITPSAARGIYDAIYCKPNRYGKEAEFRWQITAIEVLPWDDRERLRTPYSPSYIALRRNEVKEKGPSDRTVAQWASGKEEPQPILADADKGLLGTDAKGRTQRQTMALRHVRYRLHAQIRPWPGFEDRQQALEAQFRRRAGHGKCIYQPYFGCREFPAYFELVEPGAEGVPPVDWGGDLGWMLYDVFDLRRPGTWQSPPQISLFDARLSGGVLQVPDYDSAEVLKVEGGEGTC